jgi:hypothetical protein
LRHALVVLAAVLAAAAPALAGPPYVSDDPEPTPLGHWEVYNFVSAMRLSGETAGQAGLDINYGAGRDLQLTAVVPLDYETRGGAGLGDIELGAKIRLLHQAQGAPTPDLAIFPRLFLPTASARRGPARPGLFLPVWAQKDLGPWSLFGGGGYDINPGRGARNFWQGGVGVTRSLGERWSLGAEVWRQTADTRGGKAAAGVNLGATYRLSEHWTAMAAGGPGVENARETGRYAVYAALLASF